MKSVSFQFSMSQYEDSFSVQQFLASSVCSSSQIVPDKKWISDAARSTQARQRIGTWSTKEYKESACEELTQCDYSEIKSVIINYKFTWRFTQ
jgi:hypothetical protein